MSIVSLVAGISLTIVALLIWKFKAVEILAGYDPKDVVDSTRLAHVAGLMLLMLGILLMTESLLIYKEIIIAEQAVFVVVGTIIIGTIVSGLVISYFSKH